MIKGIWEKPIANIILSDKRLNVFPPRMRKKLFLLLFNIELEVLASVIR